MLNRQHKEYDEEFLKQSVQQGNADDVEKEEVEPIVVPLYNEKKQKKLNLFQRMKLKKEEKKKQQKVKQEDKKQKVLRQTPSVLPFLRLYDDYIMTKDGYMEIYQIETKDLYTRNDEDLQFLMMALTRFYRSYYESIKIIAMNFPSNTEEQKKYWNKKLQQTDDPIRTGFIQRKLFEFDFLEKERTNREFFLFVYADSEQSLKERKKQVVRSMQQAFPLQTLTKKKKQDVLFMLNNQNSKA